MSFYPSLEDMKVDQLSRAQVAADQFLQSQHDQANYATNSLPYSLQPSAPAQTPDLSHNYPSLTDFMGLEFTPEIIAANMPEYLPVMQRDPGTVAQANTCSMVAPLSGTNSGYQRAGTTGAIRELTLCKDRSGKIGLRVQPINNGVFACLVKKGSPAALAGLRFGDQILQIDGQNVAGADMDKVHSKFRKAPINGIIVAVRDRPFERTITLHKSSHDHIGFRFKNGEITDLVKDSSAARNGVLTSHNLLEVNGQNVVGIKDSDITDIIKECGQVVTITVMPNFVYKHMMKHIDDSFMKKMMDHSIPEL